MINPSRMRILAVGKVRKGWLAEGVSLYRKRLPGLELVELRDGGSEQGGYGVSKAIANVNHEIAPALTGRDAMDQRAMDDLLIALDGTPNKSRLGGNALIATSMAVLNAAANARRVPLWRHLAGEANITLPLPEIQIFGWRPRRTSYRHTRSVGDACRRAQHG